MAQHEHEHEHEGGRPATDVVTIPLAAGVAAPWKLVLSPAVGAALMSASTVVVALDAQLLRRWGTGGSR